MRVNLRNIRKPPEGFFYEVWLVDDATGEAMSLGPIRTPFPDYASMKDADQNDALGSLIPSATVRVLQTDLGVDLADFSRIVVSLSPKDLATGASLASGVPIHVAFQAEIPEEAVNGES